MESNTIVNLCGNKEFANNVKNTAATELTWTKNAFANSWRLQKVGSNCTRNFTAEDNAIMGGLNAVDGTDASKWATVDTLMAVKAGEFSPAESSWTTLKKYGDPRWLKEYKSAALTNIVVTPADQATLFANEFKQVVVEFNNADTIKAVADAKISIQKKTETEFAEVLALPIAESIDSITSTIPVTEVLAAGEYKILIPAGTYTVVDRFLQEIANEEIAVNITILAKPVKITKQVYIDGVAQENPAEENVAVGSVFEMPTLERAYTYNETVYDLISIGTAKVGDAISFVAETDTTLAIMLATPIVAPTDADIKYYWKSNYYVTELGGQMSVQGVDKNGNPEPGRLNYLNANNYTICLNGNKDYTLTYMSLALDKALVEGDTIYVTAYKNKGDASKQSSMKIRANDDTYDTGDVFNDIAIDSQLPNQVAIIVPASMEGATTIDFTRGITSTNLFVTELVIKNGEKANAIHSANANGLNNGERYNIAGQRVNENAKGIVIINGKKVLVK